MIYLVLLGLLAVLAVAWNTARRRVERLQFRLDAMQAIAAVEHRFAREMQKERDTLASQLILPGFFCKACGIFTGWAKERHTRCRSCGTDHGTL